jgi:hypothetical protein
VILIAFAFVVLGGLAGAGVMLRAPPLDDDTLCRTDRALAAHTLILVDGTDRLEARHRRKLERVIAQERARLAPHERLSIWSLRADHPQEPRNLFSRCLPRDGSQINPLFENAAKAQARWDEQVGAALESAARRAGSSGRGDASPILAGLRAAAADPDFSAEIPQRRLVLVSDLLEHARDGFTLYDAAADFAAWRTQDAAGPADLAGVTVRVAPLDRPEHAAAQRRARAAFWEPYFAAADAEGVSFDPMP